MGPSWEVEDESGHCVLNGMQSPHELGSDSHVEGFPVVESGSDECLGDCPPGVEWKPFEDLPEHTEGEKRS